jgi:hypothetical protein
MLRDQVAEIIFGTVFLFVGFAACGIAAMRWRSGMRVLVWLGIWSAMYGARPLADSLTVVGILPHWLLVSIPYIDTAILYLILVVAALVWMELSLDKLRFFLRTVIFIALPIGLAGIVLFIFTGENNKLILYNQFLAACSLSVLVAVVAVPRLSRKFLVMPNRGVLLAGTLVFAVEALWVNISRPMGFRSSFIWDSLGFAALIFSFGYVAVRVVLRNERRLQSI